MHHRQSLLPSYAKALARFFSKSTCIACVIRCQMVHAISILIYFVSASMRLLALSLLRWRVTMFSHCHC